MYCMILQSRWRLNILLILLGEERKKNSEISYPFCLRNISKDVTVDNMKKIGFNEKVHNFSINYETIDTSDILGIYKYLIKTKYCKCLDSLSKRLLLWYWRC